MKVFVADTGPLLHLHQIEMLNLLPALGEIWTTPTVWREFTRHAGEGSPPAWLHVAQPSASASERASRWVQAGLLHAGEAEALALACESAPDAILSDDTDAREMARTCGVGSRGTLGIILLAAVRGVLAREDAAEALRKLEVISTLWLSAKVRRAAREALAEIYKSNP